MLSCGRPDKLSEMEKRYGGSLGQVDPREAPRVGSQPRLFESLHATEELEDDGLTILDLESVLLSGDIVERQRDRITREAKVVVRGSTVEGETAECVVKRGASGRLYIIRINRD